MKKMINYTTLRIIRLAVFCILLSVSSLLLIKFPRMVDLFIWFIFVLFVTSMNILNIIRQPRWEVNGKWFKYTYWKGMKKVEECDLSTLKCLYWQSDSIICLDFGNWKIIKVLDTQKNEDGSSRLWTALCAQAPENCVIHEFIPSTGHWKMVHVLQWFEYAIMIFFGISCLSYFLWKKIFPADPLTIFLIAIVGFCLFAAEQSILVNEIKFD